VIKDVAATLDDDRALIEAAQADPSRFLELYERYVNRVYAFVSHRTRDRAAAEDITSEVFGRALAQLSRFEWRGVPFIAWLRRIALNALADRARASTLEREAFEQGPSDATEPEEIVRRLMVFQLVERLPDVQRQVIELRFVEEKSIREIAATLGKSEGAVKQLQLRALENLRKGMAGHE
jgi:RNA polymerase sigma-70 factor, ECF subfamily